MNNPKYSDCYLIYVLALENNKFYVGITKETARRFAEHLSGKGSAFTRKYKPICIVYKRNTRTNYKVDAEKQENRFTIDLMMKYGVDNVRGGEYCAVKTETVLKTMNKRLRAAVLEASNSLGKKKAFKPIEDTLNKYQEGILVLGENGELIDPKKEMNKQNKNIPKKKNKKVNAWWED